MRIETKICGIRQPLALDAAVEGGADMVGLVFYPPSPRSLTAEAAAALAARAPERVMKVGLFVDADDATLGAVLQRVPLDLLQLHGGESPRRVQEIRDRFGLPVMKAIPVSDAADLESAGAYAEVAERLLFDAKAPRDLAGALPGGNALSFDWTLLAGRSWPRPWMLSGGLNAENLERAVTISGASAVDVSSGVERRPGEKDPDRIRAFLAKARELSVSASA